jgi:hypothetical protein
MVTYSATEEYQDGENSYLLVTEEYQDSENLYREFFGLVPFLQLAIQLQPGP